MPCPQREPEFSRAQLLRHGLALLRDADLPLCYWPVYLFQLAVALL